MTHIDQLDHSSLIKNYNVDHQTPDSAGTATAYLGGVKGRYGTIGVNAANVRYDCDTLRGNEVESVMEKAKKAGKSVGIVTNTYIVHASPGPNYAHCPSRSWYSDTEMREDVDNYDDVKHWCKDLATQFHEKRHMFG